MLKKLLVLLVPTVISLLFATVYGFTLPAHIYLYEYRIVMVMLVPTALNVFVMYKIYNKRLMAVLGTFIAQMIISQATNFDFRISTYGLLALSLYFYFKEKEDYKNMAINTSYRRLGKKF